MNPRLKSIIYGIGAGVFGACSLIAEAPPELQHQLPQLFPESQRGYIGIGFMIAAYITHRYSAGHATTAAMEAANGTAVPAPSNPLMSNPPVQGPNKV